MSAIGRVLIVDDDVRILELVAEALASEGYEVMLARNGAEALELLWQSWDHQPDVILLDMRMPSVDGWSFAQAYRALPVKRAPVVVMTAGWRAEESAAEIQAQAVLPKPFNLADLLERVYRARHASEAQHADRESAPPAPPAPSTPPAASPASSGGE